MIDLTPLDVRNKRGDFKKNLRGYDAQEVDTFLELAAERLEQLVMENLRLRERTEALEKQVESWSGREKAVQEALVTAQELRSEMRSQAERESEILLSEARTEGRRIVAEAEAEARTLLRDTERRLEDGTAGLEELERRRKRFLKSYRQLLERELDVVQVEEERAPLEDEPIELDLLGGLSVSRERGPGVAEEPGLAETAAGSSPSEVDAPETAGDGPVAGSGPLDPPATPQLPSDETTPEPAAGEAGAAEVVPEDVGPRQSPSEPTASGAEPTSGPHDEGTEEQMELPGGAEPPVEAAPAQPLDRPRATLGADGEIHWDQDPLVDLSGGEGDGGAAPAGPEADGAGETSRAAADVRELIERLDAIRGLVESDRRAEDAGPAPDAPDGADGVDEGTGSPSQEPPAGQDDVDDRWG